MKPRTTGWEWSQAANARWLALALAIGFAAGAMGQGITFREVARIGRPAPGTTHWFRNFPNAPSISSTGHVAFFAYVTNLVDTGLIVSGLWRTVGTNPVLVALTGTPAPGTPAGVNFGNLPFMTAVIPQPLISDQGQTVFNASLQGSGVVQSNNMGIWWDGTGATELVLRKGVPGAGLPGNTEVYALGEFGINAAGKAFVIGEYHEFLGGGNVTSNIGLWMAEAGGPTLVAKTRDVSAPAPGTPFPSVFLSFRYDPVGGIFDQDGRYHFGANAGDPFDPFSPNRYSGIWSVNSNGVVEKAVVVPLDLESTSLNLTNLARLALNRSRRFALSGFLDNPGFGPAVIHGTNDASGTPHFSVVTFTGAPVPGRPVGWMFGNLSGGTLFVSDWNRTIWIGAASTTNQPGVHYWGIWSKGLSNDFCKLVVEGDPAPAFGEGAYFKNIFQYSYNAAITPPNFVANRWGQIAFTCEVVGGSAGAGTRMIYAMNRYGQLVPVIRVGQSMVIGGVIRAVQGLNLGGGFSDSGELVILAHFNGGVSAILAANVGQLLPGADRLNPIFMELDLPYAGDDGDPVNTFTGGFAMTEQPDLRLRGPMPLLFERHYSSSFARTGQSSNVCGLNWRHNFEYALSSTTNRVVVSDPRGRRIAFELSTNGWTLEATNDVPFQLAESGGQFSLGDPIEDMAYTFDTNGQLIAIADTHGASLTLTHTNGLLAQVADGLGRALRFAYEGGKLASVSDGARRVGFGYSGDLLVAVTNPLSQVTAYAYDPTNQFGGLLLSLTRPRGNVAFTQEYDAFGRVQRQTLLASNHTRFEYSGLLSTIRNPINGVRTHIHSARGELLSATDESGNVIGMKYDALGRRVAVTNQMGEVTQIAFHTPSGKFSGFVEPDGAQIGYAFQPRNFAGLVFHDLTQRSFPDGSVEQYATDSLGRITSIITRDGTVLGATANSRGQVLSSTNAAGAATLYSYNADGTLVSVRDAANSVVAYGYDALGRVSSITNADATVRRYGYDALDRLVQVVDERGSTNSFTYDANGNLVQLVDALGNATGYGYDGLDRLTRITNASGAVFTYAYDALGRLVRETDQNGNLVRYQYDAASRLTTVIDPEGQFRNRGYDNAGRLDYADTPNGNYFTHDYDPRGRLNLTETTDGQVSEFKYDALDQLTEYVDPLGGSTKFLNDTNGLLSRIILPGNVIDSAYTRNALGLVTTVRDPNGNNWLRGYDSLGRLITMTDPLGRTTTNSFDARHRVQQVGWPGGSLQITRDAAGNITRRLFSDGTDLTYGYNANNQLTNAKGVTVAYDANGWATNCNGLGMTYDSAGRLASATLAPGKTIQYGYDGRDLVTNVTDWVGGSTSLTYDEDGQLIEIARPNGTITTYTYDTEGRVASLQESFGTNLSLITLQRDVFGRVTNAIRALPLTAPFVPTNQLFSYDAAQQIVGFQYDRLGCLLDDGTRNYQWNLDSRLTRYTNASSSVQFTYNAFGYMLSRGDGAATNQFVWNLVLDLPSISIEKNAGNDARYFIHTPEGLLLHSVNANTSAREFYHFDETGSTIFLTDDTAVIVQRYVHGLHGELLASVGSSANPFTWLGQFGVRREADTGLYYIRQRFYDSETGRFISREPVPADEHPLLISPYQYAFGDPAQFRDVTGLQPEAQDGSAQGSHPKWDDGVKTALKVLSTAKNVDKYAVAGGTYNIPLPGGSRKLTVGLVAVAKSRADALLEAARAGRVPRSPEKLAEYVRLRQIERVAGGISQKIQTAGKVGDYASAAITTVNGFAAAREKVREFDRILDSIDEMQAGQMAALESLWKGRKLMSRARAEYLFRQITRNAEEMRAGAYESARYGIWADATITGKNVATKLLPLGPVKKVLGAVLPADPKNF